MRFTRSVSIIANFLLVDTTILTISQPYCLYYHLWLQQVPHFHAYTVPNLSDDVAVDSLSHVLHAEDKVAKLPVQRKREKICQQ